jgi:hypothetical protein
LFFSPSHTQNKPPSPFPNLANTIPPFLQSSSSWSPNTIYSHPPKTMKPTSTYDSHLFLHSPIKLSRYHSFLLLLVLLLLLLLRYLLFVSTVFLLRLPRKTPQSPAALSPWLGACERDGYADPGDDGYDVCINPCLTRSLARSSSLLVSLRLTPRFRLLPYTVLCMVGCAPSIR